MVAILSAGGGVAAGYGFGRGTQTMSAEAAEQSVELLGHLPGRWLDRQPASTSPPALQPPPIEEEYQPRYVLGTDHGFVAVFYAIDDTLKERTRMPESALSMEERKRLAQGIYIYTEEALVRALQDYGS